MGAKENRGQPPRQAGPARGPSPGTARSARPAAEPAAERPRIGGRYVLGDQIGTGGLATVHIGHDTAEATAGRTVAIKRLHPPLAREPEVAATLLDEGRIVARIFHPNVVPLHEIIVDEHDIFLVLEYVVGENLSALMRAVRAKGAHVPVAIACAIGLGMLRGLHAAHQATDERERPLGVVHRDVSPHNVLVGVDGRTRLLDFGLAKAAGQSHTTRPGQIKGKLTYMAPEQLRGGLVTRRSDIYAAAIVLWEVLTSDRPFGEPRDTEEMIRLLLSQRPPAPSTRAPGIPAALDAVVLRGLTLDPSGRYATAEEMALDLERAHPAAPAAAVAAWVREFAAESLAQRAALVAKEQAVTPARRGFSWARAMIFAGVAAFLVLALLTALRTAR